MKAVITLCFASLLSAHSIAETAQISIKEFAYHPSELTIKKGTTVIWVNEEKRQYHNVWLDKNGEEEGEYIFPGESTQKTFNQVGVFPYRCGPHPKMKGTITVVD